jgi:tRNA-dihydrouridine synthase
MIVIHGRTLNQSHTGEVDWDFIKKVKEKVKYGVKII